MIDRRHIGAELPSFTVEVECRRLRFFAKATGQTEPEYIDDDDAACAAGHPALPVPPTFLFWRARGRPSLHHRLPEPAPMNPIRTLPDWEAVQVGERIICTGRIAEKLDGQARVQIQAVNADGVVKLTGEALISCH